MSTSEPGAVVAEESTESAQDGGPRAAPDRRFSIAEDDDKAESSDPEEQEPAASAANIVAAVAARVGTANSARGVFDRRFSIAQDDEPGSGTQPAAILAAGMATCATKLAAKQPAQPATVQSPSDAPDSKRLGIALVTLIVVLLTAAKALLMFL